MSRPDANALAAQLLTPLAGARREPERAALLSRTTEGTAPFHPPGDAPDAGAWENLAATPAGVGAADSEIGVVGRKGGVELMNLFPRVVRTQGAEPDGANQVGVGSAPTSVRGSEGSSRTVPDATSTAPTPTPTPSAESAVAPVLMPVGAGTPGLMTPSPAGPAQRVAAPDPYEDLLTGLVGPVVWRWILRTETARAVRYGRPITVILIELGGLDIFARRWGRETATSAVLAVARALDDESRASDYLARIDAGRFGLILDQTGEIDAINCVERLREASQNELRGAEDDLRLGFGWASPDSTESLVEAVLRAERRLTEDLGMSRS